MRLIDADALEEEIRTKDIMGGLNYRAFIRNAPTIEMRRPDGWIPITRRPMLPDEKEQFKEVLDYYDYAEIFNCPLPDDGQEVLITMNGWVSIDTFSRDSDGGCSFEGYDIDDISAWMPLPEPYREESE